MASTPAGIHVVFRNHVIPDEGASKAQGRPIFRDMEVCDIRFAGNSKTVGTFPAHDAEPNATRESSRTGGGIVTYAMLYNEQYRAFKAGEAQPLGGTPLSEAPFLTEGKRRELKALNVHTVETLAAIDGTPLKQLGMGGRELKTQAQAYLSVAAGTADATGQAATIASLQQQLRDRDELIKGYTKKGVVAAAKTNEPETKPIEDCTDAELKDFIKSETGKPVKGNPSRETLLKRAMALVEPAKDE